MNLIMKARLSAVFNMERPRYESEAKCKVFIIQTKLITRDALSFSFFHIKSFALSLAFIMRLKATRDILVGYL